MVKRALALALLLLFVVAGCGFPTRVFQSKVPDPITKPPAQLEGERQAADLLAHGIEAPKSLVPVAEGLSSSLGKPQKPLPSTTPEQVDASALKVIASMEQNLVKMQRQLDVLNLKLTAFQGKTIEGTGFNIAGPGMMAVIIGLVVLAVACPPVMTLMFFAFRRMKAAAGIVVTEMEKAAEAPETAEAVKAIKRKVSAAMQKHPQATTQLKSVITNLKS